MLSSYRDSSLNSSTLPPNTKGTPKPPGKPGRFNVVATSFTLRPNWPTSKVTHLPARSVMALRGAAILGSRPSCRSGSPDSPGSLVSDPLILEAPASGQADLRPRSFPRRRKAPVAPTRMFPRKTTLIESDGLG